MKKLLLTVVVALFSATSLLADCPFGYSDTIPAPRYLTNFQIQLGTPTMLTFTDEFRNDLQLDRAYSIYIHPRHIYDLEDGCKFFRNGEGKYFYGSGSFSHERAYDAAHVDGSYGGVQTVDVNELVAACLEAGDTDVIFLVSPHYLSEDDVVISSMYRSYYLEADYHNNYDFINYYTCKLPKLVTFDVSTPSKVVRYGDNIELNCTVQASGKVRLSFLESDELNGDYRLIYDYTLSAGEAGQGKTVTYRKSFTDDGMPSVRYYQVVARDADGNIIAEESTSLQFKYSLVVNSGAPQYYSPGELVSVPKTQCDNYTVRTVNDVPVNLTDNGSHVTFTMPACAVWLNSNPANYKVQFRDYDNTVLKKEDVSCGNYATAPSAPSHPGMSFAGWDKDINQPIYGPTVFRATYTYDGMEAVLSVQGGATYVVQGESVTFDMYAKSTDVQTAVYLQTAWLDDENDELEWGTPGSYTAIYTKAEAAAGTTKTKEVVVLPNGSLYGGHRARYFRLQMRLQGSNNYVYSNIVRIDTYYEVVVNTTLTNLLAYVSRQDGTTAYYENGKIYTRPQERIFAIDNDAVECGLKFQLSPTAYAVNSGDFWIDMPADLGEATTLTISREKHHVSFYMDGQQVYNPGEYGPQQVFCGNAATPPDIIAEVPGDKLFRGWKARGEYADDAYNCVTQDMEFDALLELLADGIEDIVIPKEKATKYLIDGQLYIATPQGRIYDVQGVLVR